MEAPAEHTDHVPGLLADTSAWLTLSFIIFAVILYKAGKDAILKALDKRIEKIRTDISSAENLRVESQELLAQYERKHRDAVKEAEDIIKNAEKHAAEIKKNADIELKETMARREKQLQERLERMKTSAIAEIQQYATDIAIKATTEIIATKLDKAANANLVDQSIKQLSKNIH